MAAWAQIISGVLSAGSKIGQAAGKSSSISGAQSESKFLANIMRKISFAEKRQKETQQLGQLRSARDYQGQKEIEMKDQLANKEKMMNYQMGKGEMNETFNQINNSPNLRKQAFQMLQGGR